MSLQRYSRLLSEICQEASIEDAAEVELSGQLTVGGVSVSLIHGEEVGMPGLLLYTELDRSLLEDETDLFRILLEANALWAGTSGATLGLSRRTQNVVLCQSVSYDGLDSKRLVPVLQRFALVASHWKEQVDAIGYGQRHSARAAPMLDTAWKI
jgi:hypothetical protein